MYIPIKYKYKKQQKNIKINKIPLSLSFNSVISKKLYIIADSSGTITSKLLDMSSLMIRKLLKKKGKLIIHLFPQTSVTKKPNEIRMGKGKGSVEFWIAPVNPGTILFEMRGKSLTFLRTIVKKLSVKLPIKIRIRGYDKKRI
jgi:large subunit ribosomal protein L16